MKSESNTRNRGPAYRRQVEIDPIKCRFICIELSTGEKEVLITSLLDAEEYPYELFEELYHLRWGVEESYYVKQMIMQSSIIKYTHYQCINPFTLQYHFA